MKTVSMLEFRQNAEEIVAQVAKGQRMILTYRGKPVARLEPISSQGHDGDDPFYALDQLADPTGRALNNRQMDKIIYGA